MNPSRARPEDKRNFTLLLAELLRLLDVAGSSDGLHYLLTIAAPAGEYSFSQIEIGELPRQLDRITS